MEAIQLFKPKFRTQEITKEIEECCEKGWTGLGYKTEKFENAFKSYTEFKNAHFVSSATAGLQIALKVLKDTNKWKNKDEVITTPLTFVSSNHAILYNDLKPIFADIDDQLCLDPKSVETLITKKTKAIMYVGIGGNVGQYNKILEICKKYGLKLILDAAHMAGTKTTKQFEYGTYEAQVIDLGFKSHGNSIMASMGLVGLKYLNEDNSRRREVCEIYDQGFKNENKIKIVKHNNCKSSRHLYQIRVRNRDKIMEYLNANDVFPGVHYKDNTQYDLYSYASGTCPNAHKISKELISLPLHMFLTDKDIKHVIKVVKKAVKR